MDNLVADEGGRVDANYLPNTTRLTAYEQGDILLGNIRPYLKKVWRATNSGGCSGDVLAVRILDKFKPVVDSKFLYYLLSSDEFFSYNMQHAKGAKMPRGSKVVILNYQIPIPCPENPEKSLKIQAEIVRILDVFTALTAELTAELTARKKQYNYYRDQLLSFEEGEVEWKALGEVMSKITDGSHNPPKASINGKYPMISAKNINNGQVDFNNARMLSQTDYEQENKRTRAGIGDVLMTIVGTVGRVAVIKNQTPMTFQRSVCILSPIAELVNSDFIKYYLETDAMQNELVKQANGSAQKGIYLNQIDKLQIPIPPLAEQQRIVAILDKFDALTNSITEGLPREIELRQKQYEYYRDLLLCFPK